jgi:hypothetical protein
LLGPARRDIEQIGGDEGSCDGEGDEEHARTFAPGLFIGQISCAALRHCAFCDVPMNGDGFAGT